MTMTVKLSEIIKVHHGWPFKSEYFTDVTTNEPIVVNIGNFQYDGGFRFETTKKKGYVGAYPKEYELSPNDILLVMTCQTAGGEILGIPGRIPDDGKIYLHNQRLGKVEILRPDLVDDNYLYWLFLSKDFNKHLFNTASGTKILHTAPSRIESYEFALPPLETQRRIGDILNSLDEKISINHRMNETLKQMAMASYKHWFVDFGPFQDVEFVETESGYIPEGWEFRSLYSLAQFINGMAFKQHDLNDEEHGLPVIKISELNADSPKSAKYYVGSFQDKYYLNSGDVLFSWSASLGIYLWSHGPALLNQHIFNVKTNGSFNEKTLYFLLKSVIKEFQDIAAGRATTMGHIKKEHLIEKLLPYPPEETRRIVETELGQYFDLILSNLQERNTLKEMRDYLLPRLFSGEIDVKATEEQAEEVLACG